ncbi:MAG: guanylate kinase [Gammaproteobacteria bacterium]|nr:guanylate kinase [Gammaproteobacteria bacterium]MBU1553742.1 guanylate kinase [Gammaproteobacteria bacterium]MBU2070669.1 guanylate kinase [Gammaproteobacteria bacterium]MBU2184237.1 guanylate kinase [Gammaproteobacteria bacterium]MBU2206098.1 guanylate kinase [Gammaproteobacteria bacterium]
MQHLAGNLFIISAPSGAGKSSLIQALLKRHSDMQVSVSHTTRAPRPGEQDGVHYHFISVDEFKALIAKDEFFEWAEVFGNYYGTAKSSIRDSLSQGIDVFLDIDWQGARQIKAQESSALGIFILPPSLTELEQRLNNRGQDASDVIAKRMAQAHSEMSHANEYEYLIINDNFATALAELERIVLAQRNGYASQAARQQALLSQLLAKSAN